MQFLYNEDREVVAEKDCSGNIIRYIRGLGLISSDSEKAKTYYYYVSDEQGSVSHIIRDEDKESGVSVQGREQDRILNQYEYDAFGNTISCKEQVENRFRYMGEQYDPLTGQYYLRARYYNPVIARFTQEDTYYGDGLNLYTYCRNNSILNHDPTGHGTKENSPYSRKEQQYIDAGADPDTAKLATQCYPDANSKQDLYNKYKSQGYNATDAKKLANYEIVHGEERAKNYAANNVKKSGPDYTATSPRDNVNTDWRTQERLNAQKKASNSQLMPMNLQFFAAKGDESGSKSGSNTGIWDMTEGGGVINGREYSQHAMERMAPDTPTVRAELSRRAEKAAQQKGLEVGTKEYYEYCTKYVDQRNIPPSVIEDAISSSKAIPGNRPDTFIHETLDVKVVINSNGKVITVIPK